MKTYDIGKWCRFLGRGLTKVESEMFKECITEHNLNLNICYLNKLAGVKGLCVKKLTNLQGNCLFESLLSYDIGGESVDDLRKIICSVMQIYGDYKGFIENQKDTTLRDLFVFNECEYVFCQTDKCFYKYVYDVMCQDCSTDNSWTRLPTELVLTILSKLYCLEINIVHDTVIADNITPYITTINANNPDKNVEKIYLGLMGESHYIPLTLIINTNDRNKKPPLHTEWRLKFHKWATIETIKKNQENKYMNKQKYN